MTATGKNDETPVLARFLAVFGRELRQRWRFCFDLCVPRHLIVPMQPAPSLIASTVDDLRRHAPFDAMELATLQYLAGRFSLVYFATSQMLLSLDGGIARYMFIVQKGRIRGAESNADSTLNMARLISSRSHSATRR